MNNVSILRNKKNSHLKKVVNKLCVFTLSCSTYIYAQAPESYFSDYSLPSPTAYEMTRFEAQLPNLYTGTASVAIPLYTIDFDGFQLPITMTYHASGVKVNQEASEAGLGWSLNTTGVISRVIKGGNDFGSGNDRKGYLKEDMDFYDIALSWESLDSQEKLLHQRNMINGFYDFEPDIFSYNFFGYSGSFVLTQKDANDKVYVKKLNVDPVKIEFFYDLSNLKNSHFTITTPEGFVGHFNIREFTTSFSGFFDIDVADIIDQVCTFRAAEGINQYEVQKGHLRDITAWYLDRIESPNGKILDFTYNVNTNSDLSDYLSIGMPSFSEHEEFSVKGKITERGFSRQVVEHVYLEKIELANEIEIEFEMENRYDIGRFDLSPLAGFFPQFPKGQQTLEYLNQNLPFLKRYKTISIRGLESNSILNKQISFKQSYFNQYYLIYGSSTEEKLLYLRSRLDGITIEDQNYEFTYHKGAGGLPSKITFGQDHTGGYNGEYTNQKLAPVAMRSPLFSLSTFTPVDFPNRYHYYLNDERKPKLDYAVGGALETVRYPTGGYSSYQYDLHEFHAVGNQNGSGWTNATNESERVVPPAINAQGSSGEIQLGGLRIKEILTHDRNDLLVGRKTYDYTSKNSTQTSGILMVPLLHLAAIFNSPEGSGPNDRTYIVERSKNIPGKSLAHGNLIGYNRVKETVWSKTGDSYSSVHSFESRPTELEDRFTSMANLDHMNGQLNLREDKEHTGINSEYTVRKHLVDQFENRVFDDIKAVGYTLHNINVHPTLGLTGNYAIYPYHLPISFVRPAQVTNTDYHKGLPELKSTYNFSYDDFAQEKTSMTRGSKGETIENTVLRISDYCNACGPEINGKSMNEWMILNNMVSRPLEEIRKVDGKIISATGYAYGLEHGHVVLKEIFRHNGDKAAYNRSPDGFTFNGGYESVITFDKYNEDGKLLQQTIANGKTTSFIWDAFSNYPVVKGENIGYDELLVAYNTSLGADFEKDIRNHPNSRNALINTYDADTWVGIKRTADPAMVARQFEYDQSERLKIIRDSDQNILTDYDYNFGSYDKEGGLRSESLYIGQTKPSETNTKELEIVNDANYGITISNIVPSTHFSTSFDWPNGYQVYLAPNDSFKVPVTFTAPVQENDYSGTLTVSSDDLNGDLVIELFGTSIDFFSQLNIPKDCYVIGSYQDANDQTQLMTFDREYVRIENLGNGPLYYSHLTSNDDNLIVSKPRRTKYDEEGIPYTHYYEIPANSNGHDIEVELFSFTYEGAGDWDGTGTVTLYYREDDGSLGTADIDFFRYPNQCPDESNDPPFIVLGDDTADCEYGMDGSIVVNSGSIIVANETMRTAGQAGSGVVINITSGPGTGIGEGGSILLEPTTYPTTYNFSSTSATCDDFFGTARIKVTPQ